MLSMKSKLGIFGGRYICARLFGAASCFYRMKTAQTIKGSPSHQLYRVVQCSTVIMLDKIHYSRWETTF